MSDVIKMGLKLLLITAIATFALAFTQIITEAPIQEQIEKASKEARMLVLADATEFRVLETSTEENPDIIELYEGLANGEVVGYTFKVTSRGYGGKLEVNVGISVNGTVDGIRVGQHKETPGLGAKATEPDFQDQFSGKSADSQLSDDDISAISGATVTSKAVTRAVNTAIAYYQAELITGGDNQ